MQRPEQIQACPGILRGFFPDPTMDTKNAFLNIGEHQRVQERVQRVQQGKKERFVQCFPPSHSLYFLVLGLFLQPLALGSGCLQPGHAVWHVRFFFNSPKGLYVTGMLILAALGPVRIGQVLTCMEPQFPVKRLWTLNWFKSAEQIH